MNKQNNIFNLENQQSDVTAKIVVSLERISEAFRTLLWRQSNELGISPIQIQLLIFIKNHPEELCKVSYLSKEFNLSKPTVSEAVKTLIQKEYLIKITNQTDSRSFSLCLTTTGEKQVGQLSQFTEPLESLVNKISTDKKEDLFHHLAGIVNQLKSEGIIINQRSCYSCQFYSKEKDQSYCNLLKSPLKKSEIRLDCPEFVDAKSA